MFTLKLHIDKWLYDADRFGNDVEYEVANPDMSLIELLDEIRKKFEIKDYDISSNLPIKSSFDIGIALPQGDGEFFFCDTYDENGREATLSSYNIRSGDSILIIGIHQAGGGVVDEVIVPNMSLKVQDYIDAVMTIYGFSVIGYRRDNRGMVKIYSHPDWPFSVVPYINGHRCSIPESNTLLKDIFQDLNENPDKPKKFYLEVMHYEYAKPSSKWFRGIDWLQKKLERLKQRFD